MSRETKMPVEEKRRIVIWVERLNSSLEPLDRHLKRFERYMRGYLWAIAAGALVFAVIAFPFGISIDASGDAIWTQIFYIGLSACWLGLFAIPYTVLGLLLFNFVLRRNTVVFLIIGAFCPAASILTASQTIGSGAFLRLPDTPILIALTLPPGIVAAYVFGAIGLNLGFRRWRFA